MRTAEFVTPKHPDKMCDIISDTILDWYLERDQNSRVAVETMGGHGNVYILGEVTTNANQISDLELAEIVWSVTGNKKLGVHSNIVRQSPEIACGVDTGGAGDQGIMRGYAFIGTKSMMPFEYDMARDLCKFIYNVFPVDGKTQVTVDGNGLVHTIVASFQGTKRADLEHVIDEWVLKNEEVVRKGLTVHANPAGDWYIGGFDADTGLTGRKLAVDNYGPGYSIGGGAFSGKDATKVDRSAAYMARKLARKYIEESPGAERVMVELAYAIGVANPVQATVTINGGAAIPIDGLSLTPRDIITSLDLLKPQYAETAKWGHFGNNTFTWEK